MSSFFKPFPYTGEDLKIVMGQKLENLDNFVRYYGLAVVKKGTAFNLKELKGKKSCHTGVGRTVGWKIPVGYLLSTEQMEWKTDQYQSAAAFFGDSCAPGRVTCNRAITPLFLISRGWLYSHKWG